MNNSGLRRSMHGSRDMTPQPPIPMRNPVAVGIWARARTLFEGVNAMLHSTMAESGHAAILSELFPARSFVPHTTLSVFPLFFHRCIFRSGVSRFKDVSGYNASITVYFYFCLRPIPGISMFCRLLCRYLLIFCTPWVMATIKYIYQLR